MENLVYLNGKIIPYSEAHLSVGDHGFLYGYGLFETMRAYSGKVFLLERHLERLLGAAEAIGLPLGSLDFGQACHDVIQANGLGDARLRITVSGGAADDVPWSGPAAEPTVLVTARPYTPFPEEKYHEGFRVGLVTLRRCQQSLVSRLKSTSYLVSVLARREAAANGLDEALLLNDDGYIAEGGGSNVFFVRSGRLVTPSLDSGILPGITRRVVMELAGDLGIIVTEGTVGMAVLKQCDEAFLTNSMLEVMPLTAVTDNTGQVLIVGGGKPGEVTRRLLAAYRERVARETGA